MESRSLLSNLSVWKRGDERAVHKPLLTLMLIKQAANGGEGVLSLDRRRGIGGKCFGVWDEIGV